MENQNLFKAAFGSALAALGKLSSRLPATFVDRVLGGDEEVIDRMVAAAMGVETLPRTRCEIFVPTCSPSELVARANTDIDFTDLNSDLAAWDFYQYRVEGGGMGRTVEVQGERYEVLTWAPGEYKTTEQVREYFSALGADGNTGAFIAWIRATNPLGYYVSIPSDDALLWRDPGSRNLYAPYFDHDGAYRNLNLNGVDGKWYGDWMFVAFRKLPR